MPAPRARSRPTVFGRLRALFGLRIAEAPPRASARPQTRAPAPYTRIEWLDSTDSTNEEVHRRAAAGAQGPLWIGARRQTAGRGRRGRVWLSTEGDLTASLLLRPDALRPGATPIEIGGLSFAAGLALADLFDSLGAAGRTRLKWPNDALVDGKKASGVLIEARGGGPDRHVAVGIGVNLAAAPDRRLLDDGATRPGALADLGRQPPDPETALYALARAFEPWLAIWAAGGVGALRAPWKARAVGLGERIAARTPKETVDGVFRDIDSDGALVLETTTGVRRIHAAEVFFDPLPLSARPRTV